MPRFLEQDRKPKAEPEPVPEPEVRDFRGKRLPPPEKAEFEMPNLKKIPEKQTAQVVENSAKSKLAVKVHPPSHMIFEIYI